MVFLAVFFSLKSNLSWSENYGRHQDPCRFRRKYMVRNVRHWRRLFAWPRSIPPIIRAIASGDANVIDAAMLTLAPSIRALVSADLAAGLSAWEIAELRGGVIVPEFLCFTLAEILPWRADIYQPATDEDGNEISNLQRCSLEAL